MSRCLPNFVQRRPLTNAKSNGRDNCRKKLLNLAMPSRRWKLNYRKWLRNTLSFTTGISLKTRRKRLLATLSTLMSSPSRNTRKNWQL
jgi:hypothetical protein